MPYNKLTFPLSRSEPAFPPALLLLTLTPPSLDSDFAPSFTVLAITSSELVCFVTAYTPDIHINIHQLLDTATSNLIYSPSPSPSSSSSTHTITITSCPRRSSHHSTSPTSPTLTSTPPTTTTTTRRLSSYTRENPDSPSITLEFGQRGTLGNVIFCIKARRECVPLGSWLKKTGLFSGYVFRV